MTSGVAGPVAPPCGVVPPEWCAPVGQQRTDPKVGPLLCVGVAGFEPTTSSSRTKRATKLRYTPMERVESMGVGVWSQNGLRRLGRGVRCRRCVSRAQ